MQDICPIGDQGRQSLACLFSVEFLDQAADTKGVQGLFGIIGHNQRGIMYRNCDILSRLQHKCVVFPFIGKQLSTLIGMQCLLLFYDCMEQFFLIAENNSLYGNLRYSVRGTYFHLPICLDPNCYMSNPSSVEKGVWYVFYFTVCFHSATVSLMQQSKSMILHLNQAIPYQTAPFSASDAEDAYQQMLTHLDAQPVGSEGCLALSSTLSLLFAGVQESPDEATREAVEKGLPLPKVAAPFYLEEGSYTFTQLSPPSSIASLSSAIDNLFDGPPVIYLRLLKENPLTIIAQLWTQR